MSAIFLSIPKELSKISLTSKSKFCVFLLNNPSIPIQIIRKKIDAIKEEVQKHNFEIEIEIKEEEASDSGSSVLIYSIEENSIIGIFENEHFNCNFCFFLLDNFIDFISDGYTSNFISP